MSSRDFCYWLQGFFEISYDTESFEEKPLTSTQMELIQKHLNLVFKHEIDPSMGDKKHQQELNNIHNGFKFPETEEEAIKKWGPKPAEYYVFNMHGWYNPLEGEPRC